MTKYDYGEDSLEHGPSSDSGLSHLSQLATTLAKKELEVANMEAELKRATEELRVLKQHTIPDAMHDLGITGTITTTNGLKLTVQSKVKARISDATRAKALAWLKENNLERMVKEEFRLSLTKGQQAEAEDLRHAIEGLGLEYKNKKDVHFQTLGAFVRERDAAGEPVPEDLFNVFRYHEATLK